MKKWEPSKNLKPQDRYLNCPVAIVAVTGGIGTGKSTFCDLIESHGHSVIRADEVVKKVYKLDEVRTRLKERLPEVFLENEIDFKRLRTLFFNRPEIKEFIEGLIYESMPIVFNNELSKKKSNIKNSLFYEIPLLFEKKLENKFDFIICISLDRNEQVKRIQKRDYDGMVTSEIEKIFDSQLSLKVKEESSHFVIINDSATSLETGFAKFKKDFFLLIKSS